MAKVFLLRQMSFAVHPRNTNIMNTIIITGANRGIGYEAALQLARLAPSEQIIIGSRDVATGKEAVQSIAQKTGHKHLKCMALDLGSLASVKSFALALAKDNARISALVNNAGGQNIGATRFTKDGFEETFGINHLGPFYLTHLLLPMMAEESSITFTASGAHDPAQRGAMEMERPVYSSAEELAHPAPARESQKTIGERRYTTSKLCNVLTTYELQRHLEGRSIRVNALDPGMVPGTGLARTYPAVVRFAWKNVLPVLRLFFRNVNSAQKSGINLANLAIGKQYRGYKGKYFEGAREIPSSADSYSRAYQTDLWETSLRLAGLKKEEAVLLA